MSEDIVKALSLQLEEINLWADGSKGKYNVDRLPDYEIAREVFQEELSRVLKTENDSLMAASMCSAVATDGLLVSELYLQEIQAAKDYALAERLEAAEDDNLPELDESNESLDQRRSTSPEWIEKILNSGLDNVDSASAGRQSENSDLAFFVAQQQHALYRFSVETRYCVACNESFRAHAVIVLSCNDIYCFECLKNHFIASLNDKMLFPPRCCRRSIPLAAVNEVLSTQEQELFADTLIEVQTKDKTYCSNSGCGRFILPTSILPEKALCGYCKTSTCALCKNSYHEDDCPKDTALQDTLNLAKLEGWQRCYSCRSIVELNTGCFHMTCKCGSEFCYSCGVQWKECSCDTWNERNLLERAEEVVDREAVFPLAPQERQERVDRMQLELREVHECTHSRRFERVNLLGRGCRCEMCNDRHRIYILQCRHCHMRVCEGCRRHRLR